MAKKSRLGANPFGKSASLEWIKNTRENEAPPGTLLTNIEYIAPSELRKNPLNEVFRIMGVNEYDQLRDDIRERGILVALIAKRDGTLLSGENRLTIAEELGLEAVPVQYVSKKLSAAEERRFLLKDNILRRQLTAEHKERIIRTLFADEIAKDRRGGDRKSAKAKTKSSDELLITLPERIEAETGIAAGTAKRILAKIRKESQSGKSKPAPVTPTEKYVRALRAHAGSQKKAELRTMISELEKLIKELKSIERSA